MTTLDIPFDRYPRFDELSEHLQRLAAEYPDLLERWAAPHDRQLTWLVIAPVSNVFSTAKGGLASNTMTLPTSFAKVRTPPISFSNSSCQVFLIASQCSRP